MATLKSGLVVLVIGLWLALSATAQQGPTLQRYFANQAPLALDSLGLNASFALSLRKLRAGFGGFAVRVRRSSDSAEADVYFDDDEYVSGSSPVQRVADLGAETLSSFKGSDSLFVTIWYNQNSGARHLFNAVQLVAARQPQLQLVASGASANRAAIVFDGNVWLEVEQPAEQVLGANAVGSLVMHTRTRANAPQFSFGLFLGSWRWSLHFNWSNGYLYFDLGEVCCQTPRSVINSANVNAYRTYSIVRANNTKTIRVDGVPTSVNNQTTSVGSSARTGGEFWIGWTFPGSSARYIGDLTEIVMFTSSLSAANLTVFESEQMTRWQ
ncbi:hypothetical protein OAS86_05765 [Gammaproteobacteria bacterium]|nr:hypothetical protein [Gammaproteobacteria bacterium]